MVHVRFPARILCDDSFIKWILCHPKKAMIMSRLMRIKSSSKEQKGEHNVILDFDFKTVKALTKEHYLKASVKKVSLYEIPTDIYELIKNKDKFTRRIIYSIVALCSEPPHVVYIFTAPSNKEKYIEVPYHKEMDTSIIIKEGEDAIDVVWKFNSQFVYKRETSLRTC